MNMLFVKRELLRAVRDRKSQAFVNRRLGFDYNQIYRWEAQRIEISWLDFVKVCRICKRDIDGALRAVLNYEHDAEDVAALTGFLVGRIDLAAFGKAVSVSTYRLRSWLAGKSSPSLVDVLHILATIKDQLTDFVAALGVIEQVPSLRDELLWREKQLAVHRDLPYTGALLVALELPAYKQQTEHAPGSLASHVGLSLAEEEEALARLADERLITRSDGRFTAPLLRLDLSNDAPSYKKTRSYWLKRALEQVEASAGPSQEQYFGYLAFSASEPAYRKVIEAYDQFYTQVRFILEQDKEAPAAVRVLGVQLFDPGRDGGALDSRLPAL